MKFDKVLSIALAMIREEQKATPNELRLAFFMSHELMVNLKYDQKLNNIEGMSLLITDFLHHDKLLGFPVFPVLEGCGGKPKPPTLSVVNLDSCKVIEEDVVCSVH